MRQRSSQSESMPSDRATKVIIVSFGVFFGEFA